MQIGQEDEFSRYLRLRWTRGDGDRYVRPDAERYMRPDRERYTRPDCFALPLRKSVAGAEQPDLASRARDWLDEAEIRRLRCQLASLRLELALLRLGETWRKANFNPNQPRVPAGNPDGGQWTNDGASTERTRPAQSRSTLDADGQSYYQRGGHHEMAKGIYKKWKLRPETRRVFEQATTGTIPKGLIKTTPDGTPVGHFWNGPGGAHGRYNEAIEELGERFLARKGLATEEMTPDHAWELLAEIRKSQDPRIRDYNNALRTLRRLFRLRPGRGVE